MRQPELWQPSKFLIQADGGLRANPDYVLPGSRFAAQRLADGLAPLIRDEARGRLLDCGCGDVPYFGVYRNRCDEVVCIDWESGSHGSAHVDRFHDLETPLPYEDASFDTVLLSDVLEHIRQPRDLLREIARILRPGGRLIGSVPFLYWLHETPHDHHRYTEFGLRAHLEAVGLTALRIEPYGGHLDVVIDLLLKLVARRGWIATPLVGMAELAARTAPFRALRRRTQASFPLGYVMLAERPETGTEVDRA